MNILTNTKTTVDIAIIVCCVLFLILLIVGIALVSVYVIAFSFIIGSIGYAIVDHEAIKELYKD